MKEGILKTLVGVLIRPTSTISSICQQRPIGWAIVVYLVVCLVNTLPLLLLEAKFFDLTPFLIPVMLVGTPIIGLLVLVIMTAFYHAVTSLLGGEGSYGGLFCGFAFAALPCIFLAPLTLISLPPFDTVGALLCDLGSIGLILWAIVLHIVALRENYLISTRRAILLFLLPAIILFVLFGLLAVLLFSCFYCL